MLHKTATSATKEIESCIEPQPEFDTDGGAVAGCSAQNRNTVGEFESCIATQLAGASSTHLTVPLGEAQARVDRHQKISWKFYFSLPFGKEGT